MFKTDNDILSNSNLSVDNSDSQFSTSSDSSSQSDSNSKQGSSVSLNEKSFNKSSSSPSNDKMSTLKNLKSKKSAGVSSKQKIQMKKEDSSKNINSVKDIESLEQLLVNDKICPLNQMMMRPIAPSHSNTSVEAEYQNSKMNSIVERQSEYSKRDSIEKGNEEIRDLLQQSIEQSEMNQLGQNKSPVNHFSKAQNISYLTISSNKESSNKSLSESNDDPLKNKHRKKNKRNFTYQVNYSNQNDNEDLELIQASNEKKLQSKQSSLSKSSSKIIKTEKGINPSFDNMISNAFQVAYLASSLIQMNSLNETNRIEKQLSKTEDKRQTFNQLQTRSIKSDQNIQASSSNNKRNTQQSHQSSIFKKLSGYHDFRLSQLSRLNSYHQQENTQKNSFDSSQIASKNSVNVIGVPSQQQLDLSQSNILLEKISKYFGIQGSFFNPNSLGQNGLNNDMMQTNNLSSMDYFEIIKNYKKFFPHNNFDNVVSQLKVKKFNGNRKHKQSRFQTIIPKSRRQNILFQPSSPRKSYFCNALIQKLHPLEINYESYKPTFLSYGVSQKSDSIYPKNALKRDYQLMIGI